MAVSPLTRSPSADPWTTPLASRDGREFPAVVVASRTDAILTLRNNFICIYFAHKPSLGMVWVWPLSEAVIPCD